MLWSNPPVVLDSSQGDVRVLVLDDVVKEEDVLKVLAQVSVHRQQQSHGVGATVLSRYVQGRVLGK